MHFSKAGWSLDQTSDKAWPLHMNLELRALKSQPPRQHIKQKALDTRSEVLALELPQPNKKTADHPTGHLA